MAERKLPAFNSLNVFDRVKVSRVGKKVQVRGVDGTFTESDSVEANLMYEILLELQKKK